MIRESALFLGGPLDGQTWRVRADLPRVNFAYTVPVFDAKVMIVYQRHVVRHGGESHLLYIDSTTTDAGLEPLTCYLLYLRRPK